MKLSELFRRLSYGELSNLVISGEGSGTINENKHPQIIQYANEGLLRLHSRFVLRENNLIINLFDHITNYVLKVENAQSTMDSSVEYPFIVDLVGEPFQGDVIKITAVADSLGGCHTLNDTADCRSLFTPRPDTLQVPHPVTDVALGVSYQARHPIIRDVAIGGENLLDQIIDLPFFLEGALQSLVAHKVYSHMNTPENVAKGQEHLALADTICLEAEAKDLVNQSFATTDHKLHQRGFV